MHLLRIGTRPFVTIVAAVALANATLSVAGHPGHTPDHGIDEETACTLWAGDVDETNRTAYEGSIDDTVPELCLLAPLMDIPLDSPPAAVEQWNRGDHGNFPATGDGRSVYPPHATRSDGRFIEDAHATIFALQPSTRARLSPSNQPLYVARNGTLLGTVDYRVDVPSDRRSVDRRVTWSLSQSDIERTTLRVDGQIEARGAGTHTPSFDYDLGDNSVDTHTLGLEATIAVELERRIGVCTDLDNGTCGSWDVAVGVHNETITVRDEREVVQHDLSVGGYRASFPDGDLGLLVYKDHPWRGYDVPGGTVQGVWRFYSARDPQWDELVTATEHGTSVAHSPLHPLTVQAFPVETDASTSPQSHVQLVETLGRQTPPPTLPLDVDIDVAGARYTTSYGLVTRTNTSEHDLSGLTAYGLVRGVTAEFNRSAFTEIPVHRTHLSLTVENATEETAFVRVELHDVTGGPIQTETREGYVTIGPRRVNTSADGSVIVEIARGDGGISARFVPGHWWQHFPGYVRSSDVVYVSRGKMAILGILFEFAVPTSLFLLAMFFVDRITNWQIWPPWRRL